MHFEREKGEPEEEELIAKKRLVLRERTGGGVHLKGT